MKAIIHIGHFIAQYISQLAVIPRKTKILRSHEKNDKMCDYKKMEAFSAFFTFKNSENNKSQPSRPIDKKAQQDKKLEKRCKYYDMISKVGVNWKRALCTRFRLEAANEIEYRVLLSPQWEIVFENHKIGINQEES